MGSLLPNVRLTHRGVVEIEEQRTDPSQPTLHFPPLNVINIVGDVHNSPIQQGTSRSTQKVDYTSDDMDLVLQFVKSARDQLSSLDLPPEDQSVVRAYLASAEAQAKSPRPDSSLISRSLIAIKEIFTGAASSAGSALLLDLLTHIVS